MVVCLAGLLGAGGSKSDIEENAMQRGTSQRREEGVARSHRGAVRGGLHPYLTLGRDCGLSDEIV